MLNQLTTLVNSYAVGNVIRGAAFQSWNQPILGGIIGAVLGFILHAVTSKNINMSGFWSQVRISDRKGVLLYIMSGVITISAQISLIASMRYIPMTIANLISMSTSVIVTPLGFTLFKNYENITFKTIVGIILVLEGISIIFLNKILRLLVTLICTTNE